MFLKTFVHEVAKLQRPVTAAAVIALAVSLVQPFGLDADTYAQAASGALVAVGVIAAYVEHLLSN